jgi:hypothetical protein
MTLQRMSSPSGRGEMKDEITTLGSLSLAEQIQRKAEEGSALAKELTRDDLTEEERSILGAKLETVISEGSLLRTKQSKLFSSFGV